MTKNATTSDKATDKTPVIEFAEGGKARFRDVPLAYPLKVDGEVLDKITVRRLTGLEVVSLQQSLSEEGFIFERVVERYTEQPGYILDALDQDDFTEVSETVIDFLPEKMRADLNAGIAKLQTQLEADAQAEPSPPGEASSPTSPTPSNGANATS